MAFTYLLMHLLLQGTSTYSTDRYCRVYKGIPLNTSKSGGRNINRHLYLKLNERAARIEECKYYVHRCISWEPDSSLSVSENEVTQMCLTLCDPMDCSLPGSSIHGIFQAIVLEWVSISSPEDLSGPRMESRSPTL